MPIGWGRPNNDVTYIIWDTNQSCVIWDGKSNKEKGNFARFALCVDDDEDLYVQGDPFAWNTQASIDI